MPIEIEPFKFQVGSETISSSAWRFQAGKIQVIVGQSGSGKTSFMRSLVGLDAVSLEPTKKGAFAYVAQRPFLFDGTIGENIQYGSASDCQSQFESLSAKPDWLLWDRSIAGLSGGQQYIVSFLRGYFLSERPVLVLDEPFASLDPVLEKWAFSLMEAGLTVGRSIVFSTHRFDMLRDGDDIFEVSSDGISLIQLSEVVERYRTC